MNIASGLVDLFRGSFPCAATDSVNDWAWAIFRTAELWQAHGRDVANAASYFPGIYGRVPRNPAEKINSGYKAWEYLLYIFCLGPGLFVGLLPPEIYRSYCKLVKAFRILYQKSITYEQVVEAHELLAAFIKEYEAQFYQRRVDRLHFVRPSIHNLSHLPSEVPRVGPGCGVAQWTLERFIGLITDELRQHKHPYANLSRRGLERAQLNALKIMVPSLDLSASHKERLPRGHLPLSNGFALLRARDTCARGMTESEVAALRAYLLECSITMDDDWQPEIVRWSRLMLPNGQVARSAWKERLKRPDQLRRARDVKILCTTATGTQHEKKITEYGEVRYYFQLEFEGSGDVRTLAMVAMCSRPDPGLLELSEGVLWSVEHLGDAALRVIDHTNIEAVVAIVPHSTILGDVFKNQYFVVELPGLDVSRYLGEMDVIVEEE
ncbi:hypothetical protein AURDEDRAFT_75349 [Auricularia subglabra TFB-10046 SS5]|uniref:Uncharacterized protein n=1 Tax=Auricularia subglabra (strain TFB-10046 / SS5) TaxID=717982 RepID=J0WRK4_AURST|nr:hypothetical protein AURDEDRAFT_75349 [Auricularia subglabra TFB-10046 SS5]